MTIPDSNATDLTRADFLAAALAVLVPSGAMNREPIDRAFIAERADAFAALCLDWFEIAPRTCETPHCLNIVTVRYDVLCQTCKAL